MSVYREAELKHGRLGIVAATAFPLVESFTHEPAINEFQKLDDSVDLQNKQLNNGRLEIIAAAGMMAQKLLTRRPLF